MRIVVNDQHLDLDGPCTVEHLLSMQGLAAAACAVEVNLRLVPKRLHCVHQLGEGDRVEIVTLVGGG